MSVSYTHLDVYKRQAEGALTEVHSMLQRMNELATQAANGTNSKDSDRQAIQDEICLLYTSRCV